MFKEDYIQREERMNKWRDKEYVPYGNYAINNYSFFFKQKIINKKLFLKFCPALS